MNGKTKESAPAQANLRSRWFELRPASEGMLAFMLHRLTGLGLVFYLYLHLAALGLLLGGQENWDRFIALVRSPLVLFLDAVLLFGAVFHALNGLRVSLIGFRLGLSLQKQSFWWALALSVGLTLAGVVLIVRFVGTGGA